MIDLSLKIDLKRSDFHMKIDDTFPLSGLTGIFGPSGAGKTTLLRCIAGFERSRGRIAFGSTLWEDGGRFVPPHRRRIATVFQQPNLFHHLDVAGNLAFAARRNGQSGAVAEMVDRFGLAPLLDRATPGLSGGEAQRVALARALLTRPTLILMDEPLSALDQTRKGEILPFIEELRDKVETPILYVSHSAPEIARLSTQLIMLGRGAVAGFGPTARMLGDLTESPAGDGAEPGAVLNATVTGLTEDGLTALSFAGGTLLSSEWIAAPGARVQLFIRARDVLLSRARPEGLSALNIFSAQVTGLTPGGPQSVEVGLRCGDATLRSLITLRSAKSLGIEVGASCHAIIKTVALARGETHWPQR